jgi:hypothetical protein
LTPPEPLDRARLDGDHRPERDVSQAIRDNLIKRIEGITGA